MNFHVDSKLNLIITEMMDSISLDSGHFLFLLLLVTALGVGLAMAIKGRNPMIDGFGLIAFASLTPMIFVMGYGMVI